jgi:hypothetical protein
MTPAERGEYDRAVEWAQWAVMGSSDLDELSVLTLKETENPA